MYSLLHTSFILIIITSTFHTVFPYGVLQTEEDTANDSLVLVHVLFRHGDRTPALNEIYPKDPYVDYKYPNGYGQLTPKGKRKEYLIGKKLRNRYEKFLGDYSEDILHAQSTNYDRTKISLQLLLAALFPPNKSQEIEEGLNWQPILYHYVPREVDYLLEEPNYNCPKYIQYYNDYLNSSEYKVYYEKNKDLYEYITLSTGWLANGPQKVYNTYFALASQESLGLEPAAWTKGIWPTNITVAAADEYIVTTATPVMKRLTGGPLIKKIFDDSMSKITNPNTDNKKIYLYSAHENNLAVQLLLLDVFYPHVPPFGSYILYELHKINEVYGFKFYYQDYTNNGEMKALKLPQCEIFCPVEQFKTLIEEYFILPGDSCDDNKEI